jgi:hypothetical protein
MATGLASPPPLPSARPLAVARPAVSAGSPRLPAVTNTPPRYVVYRLYRRTDNALIYIGSTGRWGLRMSQHEREQWWWPQVGNITFQDCATRQEAYVVEDMAIVREKPLHNKRRNFAEKVAADVADEAAFANASALTFMAAMTYLLGKWAGRHVAWQVQARHALRTGGPSPKPVVNPFLEDGVAIKIMTAAAMAATPEGKKQLQAIAAIGKRPGEAHAQPDSSASG